MGFSHHDLLVEFFDGTISEKAVEQIGHILFASGDSIKPFREAVEFKKEAADIIEALLRQTFHSLSCRIEDFLGYDLVERSCEVLKKYKPSSNFANWLDEE